MTARIGAFLSNRIVISLLAILALAALFEFYFHPFSGPFYQSGLQAYQSGDYNRSVRMLEEARTYEPNNPAILELLGWSLLKTGNPAVAGQRFLAAQRLTPHDPDIQLGLAYAAMDLQRFGQAEALLNGIQKERDGWVEDSIAEAILFRREGKTKRAAQEFRQVLSMDPHNPVALRNLREITGSVNWQQPLNSGGAWLGQSSQ